jgi:aldose 1-epimerase
MKMQKQFLYQLDTNENRIQLINEIDGRLIQDALISIGSGSNLCRYSYSGYSLIDYDENLLSTGDFTGTPVLYPTPNRVKDGIVHYRGENFLQEKGGKVVFEHGLVYDEAWDLDGVVVDDLGVSARTKIAWHENQPFFKAFPFLHTLTLNFRLHNKGLTISYEIINLDTIDLPYGFGLHPYFQKISGDEGTMISLPVKNVMEANEELLPTGKILAVKGTDFDLNNFTPIGDHDLDHVFMRYRNSAPAIIHFIHQGLKLKIRTSKEFLYFVVYSPASSKFFCIESQTCSTNAHNLYDCGHKRISGLRFVKPGGVARGYVKFEVSKT